MADSAETSPLPEPGNTRDPGLAALFAEAGMVFAYTRAQAIADGLLVDVSEMAQEAGFLLPVAVTQSLWADIQDFPEGSGQDVKGRLWDVLTMGRFAIAQAVARGGGDTAELLYNLLLPRPGYSAGYTIKSVIGPGDDGKAVLTLMRPDED